MTPNERKIINCLWEAQGKMHIRLVAQKVNLSSDYTRLLCHALVRAGYVACENDRCRLLEKGRGRFSAEGGSASGGENNLSTDEPIAVSAASTPPTHEPVNTTLASNRDDKEEHTLEFSFENDKRKEGVRAGGPEKETGEKQVKEEEKKPEPKEQRATKANRPGRGWHISLKRIAGWFARKK